VKVSEQLLIMYLVSSPGPKQFEEMGYRIARSMLELKTEGAFQLAESNTRIVRNVN
jgi:hypothetical protein